MKADRSASSSVWLSANRGLLALVLVFALVYGWFAVRHEVGAYGVETDFYGLYARDAQRVLHGQMVKERDHGPGYASLVALASLATGDVFTAGKLCSWVSALGVLLFSYLTFRRLTDSRVAFWASLFSGLVLVRYSFVVNIDIVFACFALAAIWLFYKYLDEKRRLWLALAGLVSGLAVMIRYNGLLVPGGVVVGLLALEWGRYRLGVRLKRLAFYLVFFLIPVLPWETYLFVAEKSPSSPGLNLALAWEYYGPGGRFDGDERMAAVEQEVQFKYSSFREYILAEPIDFTRHYARNLLAYAEDLLGTFFPFPASHLILAGFLVYLVIADGALLSLSVFPLLAYLGASLVHFYSRYYLVMVPFLALYLAILFFGGKWETYKGKMVPAKLAVILVLVWALAATWRISYIRSQDLIINEPKHLLGLAEDLRQVASPGEKLLSRKPHLAFLSGLEHSYFPPANTVEEVIDFARRNGAVYVLYGEVEKNYRPQLSIMQYPDSVKALLVPVAVDSTNGEIVYKLR